MNELKRQAPPWNEDRLDPRIRRSRELLQSALERLLESKSFESISVGEITEAATLNRATFYDHYPDKRALLEGLVSSRFEQLLDRRRVRFDSGCSEAISGLILATCDYLVQMSAGHCCEHRHLETHFEPALVSVLRRMILMGLHHSPEPLPVAPELMAAMASGAIYAGGREWARTPNRMPVEEAVRAMLNSIHSMLHQH